MTNTTEGFNIEDQRRESPRRQEMAQVERSRDAYLALLGCSLLQLPIWGFAMTYGIFQEYYSSHLGLKGSRNSTGVIGTTMNGVMYLSMPFLFGCFSKRFAKWRRVSALCGLSLLSASLVVSSFGTAVWHLIVTQGILAALGSALLYSPTTLYLDEWFLQRRSLAYGAILSSKNVVGVCSPLLLNGLLNKVGSHNALRIWAGIVLVMGIPSIFLMRPRRPLRDARMPSSRTRRIPWHFLKHPTFYIFSIANVIFSSGYGLPQTYLSTYSNEVLHLPSGSSSLMLALFNVPGIVSCTAFGFMSDGWLSHGRRYSPSASSVTCMSALGSAISVFLFWGQATHHGIVLLTLFSITYGFFAGGYSATWGGMIKEMEREATDHNEAIDTGMLYGLLNGARGIGYVGGGLAGMGLLRVGAVQNAGGSGYATRFGSIILFTGISAAFGGWSIVWKYCRLLSK